MKSIYKLSLLLTLSGFMLQSCDDMNDKPIPTEIQIHDFVWKGLNTYYLWQADVANLSDTRFSGRDDLNNFLYNYPQPEQLFQNLLYRPISLYPQNPVDRFSVIFSDYSVLEGILSGTTASTGLDYGLKRKAGSSTSIFGWVHYILPGSSASTADIHRGDIFYAVDGIPLVDDAAAHTNNWSQLLNGNTTITLNLADYDNGNITPNGRSVTLTKTNFSENPVLINTVINSGTHKIGYMVYNGFYPNYEQQLNNAFGDLKAQGITDFVLDLRYNSGGSVSTATKLASMITGQFTSRVFAKQQWNAKAEAYFNATNPSQLYNYFTNTLNGSTPINSLNLTKIYILTSHGTASASELVINGLVPYINVVQIGDVTTGKNVGSVTLYDSQTYNKVNVNPNHRYAMQPLVLKTANRDGFGEYQNGLPPTYPLVEDFANLGVLGNTDEPLLSTAIGHIIASGRMMKETPSKTFEDVVDTQSIWRFGNEMYVERIAN